MKSRLLSILALAVVLVLGGAFAASATPVGKSAPVTKALADYFASFGVDPQYLSAPWSSVPADQAAGINTVLNMADDKVNLVFYHQQLVTLIQQALNAALTGDYSPVYLQIGNQVWSVENGDNPTNVPVQFPLAPSTTAAANSWVPLG